MNIIYDTQSTINENINLKLNGLRPRSEASEGLKNLNGKQIQICMRGFRPFSGTPGLRAGPGAADFLHVRHPIPRSRFASVGECKPRSRPGRVVGESGWGGGVPVCRVSRVRRLALGRAGCWRIRVGRRCSGQPGQPGQPGPEARPRPCGLLANQEGGCPGLPKTRGACLFVRQPGRAVGCRYGCRSARKRGSGRMPGRLRPACLPAGKCGGLSPEPRRRLAGKGRLLRVRALCRACPQK